MLQVCLDALKKGSSVLILAHRNLLLDQHKELINLPNVRISSIQTEVKHLGENGIPKIILTDEVHLAASDTYLKIFDYYKDSILIGFTATPCRLDGKPLGNIFQDIVKGPSVKYLIERGCVSPFKHYAPVLKINMNDVKNNGSDYNQEDLERAMMDSKIYGDIISNYEKLAKNKQAVAYCVSIKHCEKICELFNNAGYEARCIHSQMSDKERKQNMLDFKNGVFKIIVSVNTISEGITLPSAECCLLLRPTQSYALYMQQGMRALTPQQDKVAIIIDYVGNIFRHGSIDSETDWDLTSKKRCKNPSGEEEVLARTCQNCFLTYSGINPICPYCGFDNHKTKKEIQQEKQAELEQIEAFEKKKKRMEVGKSTTRAELERIAKERGYNRNWVYIQCKLKGIKY